MRIAGWVLLGMLGGLGAAHAQTATAPADDSAALATVRALSTRIYSTTREIEAVHAGRASAAADLDHRIAELRHEIDALRRRAGDADTLATTPLARKTRQLSMLVSNLERVAAIPATTALPSLIPAHLPANRRISFAPTRNSNRLQKRKIPIVMKAMRASSPKKAVPHRPETAR